jgi:hypothetical protein
LCVCCTFFTDKCSSDCSYRSRFCQVGIYHRMVCTAVNLPLKICPLPVVAWNVPFVLLVVI